MSYPSNSEAVAQDQIKAFVERILRMKEEARAINDDIREIYAEAKGNGFDKTVLGKLVNYVEKRTKDSAAVEEGEALWELYLTAYYGSGTRNALTHTHESSEIAAVEKKPSRLAHNQKIAGASPAPATSIEAHQEGVADGESPSPDPAGDAGPNTGDQNVATHDVDPATTAIGEDGVRADALALGSDVESVAPLSDAAQNALSLRPHCQAAMRDEITKCGGHGKVTCHPCLKAHADEEGLAA